MSSCTDHQAISDQFNIHSLPLSGNIYAYGEGGADKLIVTPEVMGPARASSPSTAATARTRWSWTARPWASINSSRCSAPQSSVSFPGIRLQARCSSTNTVEIFTIKGGSGNDTFQLLGIASGKTVNAIGNGGDDTFRLGNTGPSAVFQHPFSGNIFGTVNVTAGLGNDLVYVDDTAWSGGISPGFSMGSTFLSGGVLTQATVNFDSSLETLEFHASDSGRPGHCVRHSRNDNAQAIWRRRNF